MTLHARDRETLQLIRSIRDDAAFLRSRQSKQIGVASQSVGALAVGAMAIGVLAIGALAIGKLAIGRARIKRLEIDELVVRRLSVTEELSAPAKLDQEEQ
jgi:hypothetical protein